MTDAFVFQQKKTEGVTSSGDWVLDPVELTNAFSDKTKAIVVNTPNNPLGKVCRYIFCCIVLCLAMLCNYITVYNTVNRQLLYDTKC